MSARPVKLITVLEAIDRASVENLIGYLAVVAGYKSLPLEPGDEKRKLRALALSEGLQSSPHETGFAVQFLKEYAETIAHNGGF